LKRKKRDQEIKSRKKKIIEFVKDNPFCSRDSIFTKGEIPKSKLTIQLIYNLVKEKKIKTAGLRKQVYYIPKSGSTDLLEHLEYITRKIAYAVVEENSSNNKIFPRLLAYFLRTRLKVINAEEKRIEKHNEMAFKKDSWQFPIIKKPFKIISLNDALERLKETVLYYENPSKFSESILTFNLVTRIVDDEYYLKHQLHSHPQEKLHLFQKSKKSGVRRSASDLIETVNKGRHEFGLSLRDYEKKIWKLGVYPGGWLQRRTAETGRTLYSNINNFDITKVPKAVVKRDFSVYKYIIQPMDEVMDIVGLRRENYKSSMKKKPKKISRTIITELRTLFKKNKIEFYSDRKEYLADHSLDKYFFDKKSS